MGMEFLSWVLRDSRSSLLDGMGEELRANTVWWLGTNGVTPLGTNPVHD
jgi:hypothetical protein